MNNICVNVLVGLPATGKTTFCHEIVQKSRQNQLKFNILHICYDDFIKVTNQHDPELKTYKQDRLRLAWIIESIINLIKISEFNNVADLFRKEFPQNTFSPSASLSYSSINNSGFLLLVDDNMFYKSMRKQIQLIAMHNHTGYFLTYFKSTLENSIELNSKREHSIPIEIIKNMENKFEIPQTNEGFILMLSNETNIPMAEFEKIIANQITNHRMVTVPKYHNCTVQQSDIHKIDIILRKNINKILLNCAADSRATNSKILCEKRRFLLHNLRCGTLKITDFDSIKLDLLL